MDQPTLSCTPFTLSIIPSPLSVAKHRLRYFASSEHVTETATPISFYTSIKFLYLQNVPQKNLFTNFLQNKDKITVVLVTFRSQMFRMYITSLNALLKSGILLALLLAKQQDSHFNYSRKCHTVQCTSTKQHISAI